MTLLIWAVSTKQAVELFTSGVMLAISVYTAKRSNDRGSGAKKSGKRTRPSKKDSAAGLDEEAR